MGRLIFAIRTNEMAGGCAGHALPLNVRTFGQNVLADLRAHADSPEAASIASALGALFEQEETKIAPDDLALYNALGVLASGPTAVKLRLAVSNASPWEKWLWFLTSAGMATLREIRAVSSRMRTATFGAAIADPIDDSIISY